MFPPDQPARFFNSGRSGTAGALRGGPHDGGPCFAAISGLYSGGLPQEIGSCLFDGRSVLVSGSNSAADKNNLPSSFLSTRDGAASPGARRPTGRAGARSRHSPRERGAGRVWRSY